MDLDLSDLLQHINEIMEGGQGGVGRLGRDGAATRQASEDKRPHAAPPPDPPSTQQQQRAGSSGSSGGSSAPQPASTPLLQPSPSPSMVAVAAVATPGGVSGGLGGVGGCPPAVQPSSPSPSKAVAAGSGTASCAAAWWPSRLAPRRWWRHSRQHKLQRWFGLDHFLVLQPHSYSRRILVRHMHVVAVALVRPGPLPGAVTAQLQPPHPSKAHMRGGCGACACLCALCI